MRERKKKERKYIKNFLWLKLRKKKQEKAKENNIKSDCIACIPRRFTESENCQNNHKSSTGYLKPVSPNMFLSNAGKPRTK